MRTVFIASLSAAVVLQSGVGVTAQSTSQAPHAATPPPAVIKPVVSHSPAKLSTPAPPGLPVEAQNKLVGQYCTGCHSERGKAGGLSLVGFDAAKIDANAEVAEKMIRKLRAGMMPPPQARKPEAATIAAFVDALETKVDAAAALNPNPGWRPFQRLNRAEYGRAMQRSARHRRRRALVPAARHDQRRLRQHCGRAEFFADADGRLPARGEPDQPPRGGRSERQRHIRHLQDRPDDVADAAGRRCADGYARRHLGDARVPGRRRVRHQGARCTTSRSAGSTAATRCSR